MTARSKALTASEVVTILKERLEDLRSYGSYGAVGELHWLIQHFEELNGR